MASFKVLKWQRAVVEHLVDTRPAGHSSIAALIPILVIHARGDGSRCHPSQELMALEAGLTRNTVRMAIDYLLSEGFIEHVQNRARGLREYRLQMRDTRPSAQMGADSPSEPDARSDARSDAQYTTTNYGNSITPLESIEEEDGVLCVNCEVTDGHEDDCPYRVFP